MPTLSYSERSRVSRGACSGARVRAGKPRHLCQWYDIAVMFHGSSLVWLASGAIAVRRFRGWVGYDIVVMVCGSRWPWEGSREHDRVGMMSASILGMAALSPLALSMLQRLITSYDEWIVAGAEHDFALAQVLSSTTAGAPVVAAFKAAVA